MLTVPLISQRSPDNVAKTLLGTSKVTIGGYGCALVDLTALSGRTDIIAANDSFIKNKVFVQDNLVDWTRVPLAFPNLKFVFRSWVYDNNQVRNWIYNKKYAVIVEVDAAPIGSPKGSHFVIYLGDQKCFDPWTGKIESTYKYPNPKGYVLYEISPIATPLPIIMIPSNKILEIRNGPGSDGDKLDKITALCK